MGKRKTEKKMPDHAVELPSAGLGGPGTTLLSARALSDHLNVSRSTIRRLVKSGRIPFSRVGKQLRFDLLAVRAVIDRSS